MFLRYIYSKYLLLCLKEEYKSVGFGMMTEFHCWVNYFFKCIRMGVILLPSNAWNVERFTHSSHCSVSMYELGLSLRGRVEKILFCGLNVAPFPLDLLPPEGKCFPCGRGICYQAPIWPLFKPSQDFFFSPSLVFQKMLSAISPSPPNVVSPF